MTQSLPVHCPVCRRSHRFSAPSYPCACGAPVTPPLDLEGVPSTVDHRAWREEWVVLRCECCGLRGEWPRPELGCPCGAVLRIPVADRETDAPAASPERPASRPVPMHTARDAVKAVVLYLHRLGHRDIRRADQRPPSGIGLAGHGVLVYVDPSARPATSRDVECLWLTAMTESATCLHFSLAGFSEAALDRADRLTVPLFLLDRSGIPQPLNGPADALDADGP